MRRYAGRRSFAGNRVASAVSRGMFALRHDGSFRRGQTGVGMRIRACSAAAALGLAALPQVAAAVTVWQGDAVVTAANGTCTFPGDERRNIGVGTVLKSVFRPRAVDGNGGSTRISFTHDSGAIFVMVLQD